MAASENCRLNLPNSVEGKSYPEEFKREVIRALYQDGCGLYGSSHVHAALHQKEVRCSRKWVARLMQQGNWGYQAVENASDAGV